MFNWVRTLKEKYRIVKLDREYKRTLKARRKKLGIFVTYDNVGDACRALAKARNAYYDRGGSPDDKDCPDLMDFLTQATRGFK